VAAGHIRDVNAQPVGDNPALELGVPVVTGASIDLGTPPTGKARSPES
jgi:hypothetical protein